MRFLHSDKLLRESVEDKNRLFSYTHGYRSGGVLKAMECIWELYCTSVEARLLKTLMSFHNGSVACVRINGSQ